MAPYRGRLSSPGLLAAARWVPPGPGASLRRLLPDPSGSVRERPGGGVLRMRSLLHHRQRELHRRVGTHFGGKSLSFEQLLAVYRELMEDLGRSPEIRTHSISPYLFVGKQTVLLCGEVCISFFASPLCRCHFVGVREISSAARSGVERSDRILCQDALSAQRGCTRGWSLQQRGLCSNARL